MRFLWPTQLRQETTTIGRFGRVLHWACAAVAASFAIGGIVTYSEYPQQVGAYVGTAVGFFLVGRALRYILSAE